MGELWFIGLGLGDERDASARAVEVLRDCGEVFAEAYTSVLERGALARLARAIGRPIAELPRADLESERPILEALGRVPRVALVVAGDPFAATTHVALRLAAERAGHGWRYLPGASVLTAAASFLGLMHYRFGRVVSLPFPEPGYEPHSPLEMIGRNLRQDLHTLVLLDLRPAEGRFLTADEALRQLAARDRDAETPTLPADRPVAVVARVGTDAAAAWYGPRGVLERMEFGPPLHSIVVPAGTLHFQEEAALARYAVADRGGDRER